jgi:hypothetical protein
MIELLQDLYYSQPMQGLSTTTYVHEIEKGEPAKSIGNI